MELTSELYNKTAKYVMDSALSDEKGIMINYFTGEKEYSDNIATIEINIENLSSILKVNYSKSVEILDKVLDKLMDIMVENKRNYNADNSIKSKFKVISGVSKGTRGDGKAFRSVDYYKDKVHQIWDPDDGFFIAHKNEELNFDDYVKYKEV